MNRYATALLLCLFASPALATCPTPLTIKDASAATQNLSTTDDASGNCMSNIVAGGDTGSAPIQTATPANSSHAAGVSIGGLFSVPMARINGGSGILTNLIWISTGGNTIQLQVRLWDKNPASTTCTDNSAFASNITDDQHLIAAPLVMTPAVPVVATGDTHTYGYLSGLSINYKNQDTSPGKNVYACVIAGATSTLDDNAAVYLNLTGTQD